MPGVQKFLLKCSSHLKILAAGRLTWSKFLLRVHEHREQWHPMFDPATWRQGFMHPCIGPGKFFQTSYGFLRLNKKFSVWNQRQSERAKRLKVYFVFLTFY